MLKTETALSVESREAFRSLARQAAGLTGRGRTPKSAIVAFLAANPKTVREIAAVVGIEVPARGKIPADALEAVAATV